MDNINVELEYPVIKAISALLNSKGGYLFIGVNDSGEILGIEKDYSTLGEKQNQDGFLLQLSNMINSHIGKEVHPYLSPKIENIKGKEICVITISRSNKPVYLTYKNREEFCIRGFNSSQTLTSLKQIGEYIKNHWKD